MSCIVLSCLVLSLWCLLVSSHGASLLLLGMDDVIQTASASDPIPWMVSLSACSSVGNSADADAAPFKITHPQFPLAWCLVALSSPLKVPCPLDSSHVSLTLQHGTAINCLSDLYLATIIDVRSAF